MSPPKCPKFLNLFPRWIVLINQGMQYALCIINLLWTVTKWHLCFAIQSVQTDTNCCVHVCTQDDALEDNADVSIPVPIKKWCLESFIKVFYPVFKLGLMPNAECKWTNQAVKSRWWEMLVHAVLFLGELIISWGEMINLVVPDMWWLLEWKVIGIW